MGNDNYKAAKKGPGDGPGRPAGGAAAEAGGGEPKCSVARLRQDCLKLFGVTTSTYDGATFGLGGEFTVGEMRERIEEWGKCPICKEKGGDGHARRNI